MVLVPAGVVTLKSTVPDPAGDVAVHDVAVGQLTFVPAVDPKLTVASLVKPVPMMVTGEPPVTGPAVGLTDVTVGGP